mmetsp:Transcript_2114/g.3475  ORF Transcript_2114/g.3475 Transcript_2114/m.3475 type:complete len:84 (+) Transcript_2114:60-311(+)
MSVCVGVSVYICVSVCLSLSLCACVVPVTVFVSLFVCASVWQVSLLCGWAPAAVEAATWAAEVAAVATAAVAKCRYHTFLDNT